MPKKDRKKKKEIKKHRKEWKASDETESNIIGPVRYLNEIRINKP